MTTLDNPDRLSDTKEREDGRMTFSFTARPRTRWAVSNADLDAAIKLALEKHEGRAPRRTVVNEVGDLLTGDFGPADLEWVCIGGLPGQRWEKRTHDRRKPLIKQGVLDRFSPHGIWRLR